MLRMVCCVARLSRRRATFRKLYQTQIKTRLHIEPHTVIQKLYYKPTPIPWHELLALRLPRLTRLRTALSLQPTGKEGPPRLVVVHGVVPRTLADAKEDLLHGEDSAPTVTSCLGASWTDAAKG